MSKVDIIIDTALGLKGCHAYDNYCQRFVRVCYEAAGISGSASSAMEAYEKWCLSSKMSNVPRGAAVYFKGTNSYGHVGIYTGNGNVIHAANGVRVQSLEYCAQKYTYLGWGWQGGQKPDGASGRTTAEKDALWKAGLVRETEEKSKKKKTTVKAKAKSKTIEEISRQSLFSASGGSRYGRLDTLGSVSDGYELLIEDRTVYLPALTGEMTLEYKRQFAPGRLMFNVLKDNNIDFGEGSPVRLRVGGEDIFRGYVFEKKRKERDIISVICYDSLRYLKNRDTILYRNKTYGELLGMIVNDYGLQAGDIAATGYVIAKQLAEGTLFDILADAADITYTATGKTYVLLDDFGKICLRNTEDMFVDTELNSSNIGSYTYKSSIDRDVYNSVLFVSDDKKAGIRRVYSGSDDNVYEWGVLQKLIKPKEEMTTAVLNNAAKKFLEKYSRKRRYLTLENAKGNIALRGGSVVRVKLDIGDLLVNELMSCEKIKHTFADGVHLMDISLYGREGEFDD